MFSGKCQERPIRLQKSLYTNLVCSAEERSSVGLEEEVSLSFLCNFCKLITNAVGK